MNFESFNFHPSVVAGVKSLGYTVPTPIQEKSIPVIMQGRDVIGLAQTGTGKTAAFVLPILHKLVDGRRSRIRALVISPTRELAEQTHTAISEVGKQTGLRSVAIYGGVSMDQQVKKLRSGIEIAVACPGRLLDHLRQGTINLLQVEILVIDEADRMFDMGFLPNIREILNTLVKERQTILFSATMPADIKRLVLEFLHDPITVQVGRTVPVSSVSHFLYPVTQQMKTALLVELLGKTDTEAVLVFTRTKYRAERVASQLSKAGYNATSLQGNMSQNQRQSALNGFRTGSYKILVATDIAARGIDIL
ncbi:MAG: DEAD/DEAH box helicase, partial [Chloroflexi bacterium]|nr:DEAD/DEAH box helicase [Chloroflexota bacterium]